MFVDINIGFIRPKNRKRSSTKCLGMLGLCSTISSAFDRMRGKTNDEVWDIPKRRDC